MATLLSVLAGIGSVTVLFISMLIYKAFDTVSSTKTSGLGAIAGVVSWVVVNPVLWLSALVLFFGVIVLGLRQYRLAHS